MGEYTVAVMASRRSSAFVFSIVIVSLASFLPPQALGSGFVEPLPLHSALEAAGVLIALITAAFLLQRDRNSVMSAVPVAVAFLGMGILDSFHAAASPGNAFVLLRCTANLFGALGFMLAWVPEKARRPVAFWNQLFPIGVAALALVIGILILRNPNEIPAITPDGQFTPFILALSFSAGVLFLASVPRFAMDFRRSKRPEPLLFACIGLLFGLAGLMFPRSLLWNDVWWSWHGLRLTAFAIVFLLVNHEHRKRIADHWRSLEERGRVELELRNLNAQLEQRVAERTTELTAELTERKHAQESLRRSQESLVRAQAIAHIGDWERDLLTNALVWSDEMYRLVGMEPGDPNGTYANFLALVHPEDRELVKTLTADAIREGKPYAVQYRLHREKDGADLIIRATADVVRDQRGEPLKLVGTAQDITERKRDERALSESQERLRAIIEAEPECVKLLDAQGHLLEMNPAGLRMIEADHFDQVRGQCIYPIVVERDRNAFAAVTNQVFQGQEGTLQFEIEGLKGGRKWLETHAVPLYDFQDKLKIYCLLAITRDITERKAAEENLRRFAAELAEANRLKDIFTDVLRHDILNPVTAIKISTELLLTMESDDRKTNLLQKVRQSTVNLVEMTENAARLASVTAGQALEFFAADPVQVLRSVLPDFEHKLAEKNITLTDHLGGGFSASLNPMVKDVFANLISNAIKFNPNGGTIDVIVEDRGESWVLCVKDQGMGVPDEYKQKIFNRFERHNKEGVKGSGLGLTIAKQIVDLHGGEIWVEDNPSGGSNFCVKLPKMEKAVSLF